MKFISLPCLSEDELKFMVHVFEVTFIIYIYSNLNPKFHSFLCTANYVYDSPLTPINHYIVLLIFFYGHSYKVTIFNRSIFKRSLLVTKRQIEISIYYNYQNGFHALYTWKVFLYLQARMNTLIIPFEYRVKVMSVCIVKSYNSRSSKKKWSDLYHIENPSFQSLL